MHEKIQAAIKLRRLPRRSAKIPVGISAMSVTARSMANNTLANAIGIRARSTKNRMNVEVTRARHP